MDDQKERRKEPLFLLNTFILAVGGGGVGGGINWT